MLNGIAIVMLVLAIDLVRVHFRISFLQDHIKRLENRIEELKRTNHE